MKCSDIQFKLPIYSDGDLGPDQSRRIAEHLDQCPLCRQRLADTRDIVGDLSRLSRPQISPQLRRQISLDVSEQLVNGPRSFISSDLLEWLQMKVFPYGMGVVVSTAVAFSFLLAMFSGLFILRPAGAGVEQPAIASVSKDGSFSDSAYISPADFAKARLDIAMESPSVNPQGALIALTKSLVRGGMKDDEVVVVADVFGNGLARIEEVVEPSRDRKAIGELQKALNSDSTYAPFVPASMENRPENVRVVLKFQSVDVKTSSKSTSRSGA